MGNMNYMDVSIIESRQYSALMKLAKKSSSLDATLAAILVSQEPISLDCPVYEKNTVYDFVDTQQKTPEQEMLQSDYARILDLLFKTANLGTREKEILQRRYGLAGRYETLEEIGYSYNITRERIRQIEAKALRKIKGNLRKSNLYLHDVFSS